MPAAGWKKLSADEIRLAKRWYEVDELAPSDIAARLGRDKSVMTRLLVKQVPRKPQGAPKKLSGARIDLLAKRLKELIVKADCKYTVTVQKLKSSTRTKAAERTILSALHDRNIYFRKLREKPVLTPADVRARRAFPWPWPRPWPTRQLVGAFQQAARFGRDALQNNVTVTWILHRISAKTRGLPKRI